MKFLSLFVSLSVALFASSTFACVKTPKLSLICPNSLPPANCLMDPCSNMLCPPDKKCLANYCDNFPNPFAGACSATCVPSTATCSLNLGQTFPLQCGEGHPAFPSCTEGCNGCICDEGGQIGGCTDMFCSTVATCTDVDGSTYATGDLLPKKIKKSNGEYVNDNTNICVCGPYGRLTCSSIDVSKVVPVNSNPLTLAPTAQIKTIHPDATLYVTLSMTNLISDISLETYKKQLLNKVKLVLGYDPTSTGADSDRIFISTVFDGASNSHVFTIGIKSSTLLCAPTQLDLARKLLAEASMKDSTLKKSLPHLVGAKLVDDGIVVEENVNTVSNPKSSDTFDNNTLIVIAVSVSLSFLAIVVAIAVVYKRRRKRVRDETSHEVNSNDDVAFHNNNNHELLTEA